MYHKPLLAGTLVGLTLSFALYSSLIAWHLNWRPSLGPAKYGVLYHPLAVVGWVERGGLHPVMLEVLPYVGAIVVAAIFLFVMNARQGLKPGNRPKDEGLEGAAQMLREKVVSFEPKGVLLGLHHGKLLFDNTDGVRVLIGPTRGGKGVRHVVGTLLSWRQSLFVYDPKGDLFGIVGRFWKEFGHVHVIDPTRDDPGLATINPLQFIRKEKALEDCRAQARALAFPRGDDVQAKDETWDEAATNMLTAVIYHVWSSPEPTLRHVAYWVREIKGGKYPTSKNATIQQMLTAHSTLTEKVRDSVNFTMETKLGFLLGDTVCKTTDKTSFDPNDLMTSDKPVAIFLSIPISDAETMRPISRLIINTILTLNMRKEKTTQSGKTKARDCLLVLDEFPQLGQMDVLEKRLGVMSSYGFKPFLVCQNVEQIYKAYGQYQAITGMSNALITIPRHSVQTNKMLIDLVGNVWVSQRSLSKSSKSGEIGMSTNKGESESRIPILDPSVMRKRARKESFALVEGMAGWVKAAPYYKVRRFRGLYDWPPRD